jgi:hypothetical protein
LVELTEKFKEDKQMPDNQKDKLSGSESGDRSVTQNNPKKEPGASGTAKKKNSGAGSQSGKNMTGMKQKDIDQLTRK